MSACTLRCLVRSIRLTSTAPPLKKNMATSTYTGEILPKPTKNSFGLIKVSLVIIPFLLLGARISQEGAAWLEEHDIFSPEDDD